jgi:hypothetical protein
MQQHAMYSEFASTRRARTSWLQLRLPLRSWLEPAHPVLFWILPAALTLYAKCFVLSKGGYYLAAVQLGKVRNEQSMLTALDKFSLILPDLWCVCVLIPLGLVLLSRCLSYRWRFWLCLLVSLIASLAMFVQLRSFQAVGRFLTLQVLSTAFSWGWQEPLANLRYVGSMKLLVMLPLALVVGAAAWRPLRSLNRHPLRPVVHKCLDAACFTCFLIAGSILALSWVPRALPATSFYSRNVLISAVKGYWEERDVDTRPFAKLQTSALLDQYRAMVHAPMRRKDPQYWGKAQGSNILIFVLETTPARFLDFNGPLTDLPNFRRLRERSFVAENHFTTYPKGAVLDAFIVVSARLGCAPGSGRTRHHADTFRPRL